MVPNKLVHPDDVWGTLWVLLELDAPNISCVMQSGDLRQAGNRYQGSNQHEYWDPKTASWGTLIGWCRHHQAAICPQKALHIVFNSSCTWAFCCGSIIHISKPEICHRKVLVPPPYHPSFKPWWPQRARDCGVFFHLCERSLVCSLALTHQGTVVLLKIVNYVCLRKCQCFLKLNNRTGKDLAVLFVTQVAGRQNDAFIIMSRFKETNDCCTI